MKTISYSFYLQTSTFFSLLRLGRLIFKHLKIQSFQSQQPQRGGVPPATFTALWHTAIAGILKRYDFQIAPGPHLILTDADHPDEALDGAGGFNGRP